MHRPLVAGCLAIALAGIAYSQSAAPPDPTQQPKADTATQASPDSKAATKKADEAQTPDEKAGENADAAKGPAKSTDKKPAKEAGKTEKPDKKTDSAEKAKKSKKPKKPDKTKSADRDADFLGQCLRDWDAGTHMTRRQWARTCRRVAANRTKYARERLKKKE